MGLRRASMKCFFAIGANKNYFENTQRYHVEPCSFLINTSLDLKGVPQLSVRALPNVAGSSFNGLEARDRA